MCLSFLLLCAIPGQLCPWSTPTSEDNVLQCRDGTCNGVEDAERWSCCKDKGGRTKCPKNWPIMCADKSCSPDGTDYCCYDDCGKYGGPRKCEQEGKFTRPYMNITRNETKKWYFYLFRQARYPT